MRWFIDQLTIIIGHTTLWVGAYYLQCNLVSLHEGYMQLVTKVE